MAQLVASPGLAESAGHDLEELRALRRVPRIDLRHVDPQVSLIVPAMNEARNLPWLAQRIPAGVHEIILVDGRSVDDTVAVARSLWPAVRVITQTRRGKGNALACGFHAATGDVIVMIDADGSMDPGEIPYFVQALQDGADYVKGSRFIAGGGSTDITRMRAAGNRFLNGLTNLSHGSRYTDLCYGYNAFWTRILPVLGLDPGHPSDAAERRWGDGFEIETLINIRALAAGLRIAEIASFESGRLHGRSNLNAMSDGLRVLRTIAMERRSARRGTPLSARSLPSPSPAPAAVPAVPVPAVPVPVPAQAQPMVTVDETVRSGDTAGPPPASRSDPMITLPAVLPNAVAPAGGSPG